MNPLLIAVAVEVLAPAVRSLFSSLVAKAESGDDEFEAEGLREERNRADIAEQNATTWYREFATARGETETLRLELEETRAELESANATLDEVQAAYGMLQDALGGMR